jgi:hypothetical protein
VNYHNVAVAVGMARRVSGLIQMDAAFVAAAYVHHVSQPRQYAQRSRVTVGANVDRQFG